MQRKLLLATAFAIFGAFALVATPGSADGVYVTGADWNKSSRAEKLAYLLGISNLMSADYDLQRKGGKARGSAISELYAAVSNVSIEQVADAIDGWYDANPEQLNQQVLDAIWLVYVER